MVLKQIIRVLFLMLVVINSSVMARNLSETYLSKEEQEIYYDYQVDVFLQLEGYGDQHLLKIYPKIVKQSYDSLWFLIHKLSPNYHKQLKVMLLGPYLDNYRLDVEDKSFAIKPIIHHKSDMVVDETLVIDYPLIVEGDLTVKGNLLIASAPIIIMGDVYVSKNLLYEYLMDDQGLDFYVQGKVIVDGNAFLDGDVGSFFTKAAEFKGLSAKHIFSLSTHRINSGNLIPFPNSPSLIRPSILPWSGEVDTSVLFSYLERDIEPFSRPYESDPKKRSWDYFLNAWEGITDNSFYHPEIAGLKNIEIGIKELSEKGKKQVNKKKGSLQIQADLRTARGFCTENITDDLKRTFDSDYLYDASAFKNKVNKPAEVKVYETAKPNEYTSSCKLKRRYDALEYLLRGDLDESLVFPYGRYTEDDYIKAYNKDKPFISIDPYLATFWLLRFGIVFDERYSEVEKLVKKLDHPLVKSVLSFFKEKAYRHSAGSFTGRAFSDQSVSYTELLEGKYKEIKTGNDAFRRFHSDYIYYYYKNNKIQTKSTLRALAYSINNESSGLLLEKAMLFVETARSVNLWGEVTALESSKNNPLAWRYIQAHRLKEAEAKGILELITDISNQDNFAYESRIKAIKYLDIEEKIKNKFINRIKKQKYNNNYLGLLGVKDEENKDEILQLAKELINGKHFYVFQQLLEKKKIEAASHLSGLVVSLASDINKLSEKNSSKIDKEILLEYIDYDIEHNNQVYVLESAIKLLMKKDKKMVQQWAEQKLKDSRLHWSKIRTISETASYVELFRKILK